MVGPWPNDRLLLLLMLLVFGVGVVAEQRRAILRFLRQIVATTES